MAMRIPKAFRATEAIMPKGSMILVAELVVKKGRMSA